MKVEVVNSGNTWFYHNDGTMLEIRPNGSVKTFHYSYRHRCRFNGKPLTKEKAQELYDAIPIIEWRPSPRKMFPFSKVRLIA